MKGTGPKLDIIISHYKEKWEIGEPMFKIISLQRMIDFNDIRVILVNDGHDGAISQRFINRQHYPFETKVITIQHGGVSAARNAGMKAATAEWITFCDFDDTYTDIYSLYDVFSIFPARDFDLLWSKMLVEDQLKEEPWIYYSPERANFVFTHAKFYRRSYLINNGFKFDTELSYNEDSLFNALIIAVLDYKRIGEIKSHAPIYSWCRRKNSVTSRDGAKDPATWGHFCRNWKVIEFYIGRLPFERISGMLVRSVYDTYYMLKAADISEEMHDQIEKEFRNKLALYGEYWAKPCEEHLEKIRWLACHELSDKGQIEDDFETVEKWVRQYF